MKRYVVLLAALAAFASVGVAHAVTVEEAPLNRTGSAGIAVSVSTSSWTKINSSTSRLEYRAGFRVNNKASNTANMACTLASSAPSQAITVFDYEVIKGSNQWVPAGNNLDLYCVSLNTSAESINLREYGQ